MVSVTEKLLSYGTDDLKTEKTIQLALSTRKPKPLQEKNNSTQQDKNNSTRPQERNNSTQQWKTTQLSSRNQTTQLCTAVDRLHRLYSRIGFFYLLTSLML
ncbi:hypothetical protein TNCV_1743661 [Trichonephila clavipes]|nr:hypothetical protein TNCV_1743661 [Trichonephila clavipes]